MEKLQGHLNSGQSLTRCCTEIISEKDYMKQSPNNGIISRMFNKLNF